VAKALARQIGPAAEQACAPYQFALSTRAGTDCVGHAIRALTDFDEDLTILSVDGVGAYDFVSCQAMLSKLHQTPVARDALPFVRLAYAYDSEYTWEDEEGEFSKITQAEGGEQGDPLMPLLFCLGTHDALDHINSQLLPGEAIFAYLDDAHTVCKPERTVAVYELIGSTLSQR
jgi:hypothetical protein